MAVTGLYGSRTGSSRGKIPCSLMTFDGVLCRGEPKELGRGMERWVWYPRRQEKKVVALKSFTRVVTGQNVKNQPNRVSEILAPPHGAPLSGLDLGPLAFLCGMKKK